MAQSKGCGAKNITTMIAQLTECSSVSKKPRSCQAVRHLQETKKGNSHRARTPSKKCWTMIKSGYFGKAKFFMYSLATSTICPQPWRLPTLSSDGASTASCLSPLLSGVHWLCNKLPIAFCEILRCSITKKPWECDSRRGAI